MSIKIRKKIEEVKVSELVPYENNPRINDGAVPALVEAIKQLGFNVPLVIDKNNVVICGHTRLKAAQELGMVSVPCLRADELTEEQIKAFRLADNKTAELSAWDFEKLYGELEALKVSVPDFNYDLLKFGTMRLSDPEENEETDAKPVNYSTGLICPRCGYIHGGASDEDNE